MATAFAIPKFVPPQKVEKMQGWLDRLPAESAPEGGQTPPDQPEAGQTPPQQPG